MRSKHRVSRTLSFDQANDIAYRALSNESSISALSAEKGHSRQTIRNERDRVQAIVNQTEHREDVLFYLPVTATWLSQLVIALVFMMNASYRNITQFIKDLFDYSFNSDQISKLMKTVYRTVNGYYESEDLSAIRVASPDELYYHNKPILTGVAHESLYTYSLQKESQRDEDTWRIHLMDLKDKGFNPATFINDQANGLHSAHKKEFQGSSHLYDVFHAMDKIQKTCRYFNNRFRASISDRKEIDRREDNRDALTCALETESQYKQIKSTLNTLSSWMHHDVLMKAGADYDTRSSLYDFIVDELKVLEKRHPHRLSSLRVTLENKKSDLLKFVKEIDVHLNGLSKTSGFSVDSLWLMCELVRCDIESDKYAIKSIPLIDLLGDRFDDIESQILSILNHVHQPAPAVRILMAELEPCCV